MGRRRRASEFDTFEKVFESAVNIAAEEMERRVREWMRATARPPGSERPSPSRLPAREDPYTILGVLPSAPREVVEGVFRVWAKLTHPDTGGTPAKFRRVQAAMDAIRTERGWT